MTSHVSCILIKKFIYKPQVCIYSTWSLKFGIYKKKVERTFSSFDPLSHMTYKKSIEILKL